MVNARAIFKAISKLFGEFKKRREKAKDVITEFMFDGAPYEK